MFINTLQKLLDIILPRSSFQRAIDEMTFQEFIENSGGIVFGEYQGVIYLFNYRNPFVRRSIHSLKYRGNRKIAGWYGQILYDSLLEEAPKKDTVITPVPLSRKKMHKRGWNQCELLVREVERLDIGDFYKYSYKHLYKKRDTKSQTKMRSKKERLRNIKNSFGVHLPASIYGESIVLIDDVVTTGSTLKEASEALRKSGARKVKRMAVAH